MANLIIIPEVDEGNDTGWQSLPDLGLDQAYVSIKSNLNVEVPLYVQGTACQQCKPYLFRRLEPGQFVKLIVKTFGTFGTYLRIGDNNECGSYEDFQDKGEYLIKVDEDGETGKFKCDFETTRRPSNIYLPILYAVCFYVGLAILWNLSRFIHQRCTRGRMTYKPSMSSVMVHNQELGTFNANETENKKKVRLICLDVFRGLTMSICIFVINGAGGYYFFEHALWNGLYLSDFVFPWFMWIMGAGISLSVCSQLKKKTPRWKILANTFRRSCLLFLFGVMFNTSYGHNDLSKLRVPGVLQRFSICYLVVSTITVLLADARQEPTRWWDIGSRYVGRISFIFEWIIYAGVLTAQIYLTLMLDVPGCPRGYVGPGGNHMEGKYRNCTGGVAGYIDGIIIGKRHIYQNPTFKILYESGPFDPEGLLGCLTSIFMVFTGLKAGRIIQQHKKHATRCVWLVFWALATGITAAVLCKGSLDGGWIPINKNLWSVSFILCISSTSFVMLAILYYVIDVKRFWNGSPFFQPGMNSILLYLGSSFLGQMFPFTWKTEPTHGMKMIVNLWQTTLWVIISIYLHRKNMYFVL